MNGKEIRIGIGAATLALACVLSVMPAFAGDVRVGDFYLEIAKNRYPAVSDGVGAERVLRAEGFRLPALDLRKLLTEGDIVRISEQLGIRLSTTRPEAPATKGQVEAFARAFAGELSGAAPVDPNDTKKVPPRPDPNPDKGKSKGFYKSVSEPI